MPSLKSFPLYQSPDARKAAADQAARAERLVGARQQDLQNQLAANVLRGTQAAETTPGYTAHPGTGLLVSNKTIEEMAGGLSGDIKSQNLEPSNNPELSPFESLNLDVEAARNLYRRVVDIDTIPTEAQILEALKPEDLETLQNAYNAIKLAFQHPRTLLVPTGLSLEQWGEIDSRIGKRGHGRTSVYEEYNNTGRAVRWSIAVLPTNPYAIQRNTASRDAMDISVLVGGGIRAGRIAPPRTEDTLALMAAASQTDKPWPFGEKSVHIDTETNKAASLRACIKFVPSYDAIFVCAFGASKRRDDCGALPSVRVELSR